MFIFKKTEWKIFLLLFFTYIIFSQYTGGNEKSLIDLTFSVGYHNNLTIDNYHNSSFPTKTFDKAYYYGHYYSDKAIGLPIIGSLIIKIIKIFIPMDPILNQDWKVFYIIVLILIGFTSSLFTAFTSILIFRISLSFLKKKNLSILLAITYGYSSLVIYNAINYKTHAMATFFTFLSFYLIYIPNNNNKISLKRAFFSGLSAGIAIITEYPAIIIIFFCIIYLFRKFKIKQILIFIIPLVFIFLIQFLYNYLIYYHFFILNYSNLSSIWKSDGLKKIIICNLKVKYIIHNIIQLLFFPFKGIFIYFPLLFYSIIGFYKMRKKYKREIYLILTIFISILFWNASRCIWWCNEGLMCRRFLIFIPFLMIPIIISVKKKVSILFKIVCGITIFIGIMSLQRTDRIGGFIYGIQGTIIKYTFIDYYQIISLPIKNYYFPLFLRFGPSSDLLNKILGIDLFPFINILLIILLITIIWKKDIYNYSKKNLKFVTIIFLIFLILIFLRIVYNDKINTITEETYTDYFLEKNFKYKLNENNTYFFLTSKENLDNVYINKFKFNIPFILKINNTDIISLNKLNQNWYYPNSLPSSSRNHNYMYQNSTINLYSKKEMKISLKIIVRSYFETKSLELYLNDNLIETNILRMNPKNISIILFLNKGINTLRFHVPEGCTFENVKFKNNEIYKMDFSRHIRCKSLDFDTIEIN
jgi:hypothetical protein